MSSWSNLIQKIDDRMNPIVVKELRQAVQGKFLTWNLLGFLLLQMTVLSSYLISADNSMSSWMSSQAGRPYFMVLLSILLLTSLFLIPLYTGARLSLERSDDNADLLYITTLSPRAIVAGKFWASLLLVVFLFSACTPFMTISFLLRGIDIPSIFLALLISFIASAATIQLSIFLACLPLYRWFRLLVALSALGVLSSVFGIVIGMTQEIMRYGILGFFGSRDVIWVVVGILLMAAIGIGLMFVLSVSLLTPPSANRVLPIRILLSVAWLTSAIYSVSLSAVVKSYRPFLIWSVIVASVLSVVVVFTVSEREHLGERLRRAIPHNNLLRLFVFPFYSGVGSGLVWILLCATLSVVLALIVFFVFDPSWSHAYEISRDWFIPVGVLLFAISYALTGWGLRRTLFSKFHPGYSWFFAVIVFALSAILPLLLSFFLGTWKDWQEGSLMLTPFVLGSRNYGWQSFWVSAIWSGAAIIASIGWLSHYYARFVTVTEKHPVVATSADDASEASPSPAPGEVRGDA